MNIWEQFRAAVQEDPNLLLYMLLLLFLLWFLLQLLRLSLPDSSSSDQENGSGSAEDYQQQRQREAAINKASLERLLEAAQNGTPENKEVAQEALRSLLKGSRYAHLDLQDVSSDAEAVESLAQELDMETVLGYSQALNIELPRVKAQNKVEKTKSLFPTLSPDVEMATLPEEILNASPEELYQRDQTYERFAKGELQVVSYYEYVTTEAILHLVLDVSSSMLELLNSGVRKSIIARAVAYKLLTRARIGAAKFLLRFFDGNVHRLKKANNPEEAQKLAELVRDNGFSGGGTEILGAIQTAVRDIKKEMQSSPSFAAEIMLITDGEPNTPFTADELREILGDVKLHVVIIGNADNEALKSVATSYTRFQ